MQLDGPDFYKNVCICVCSCTQAHAGEKNLLFIFFFSVDLIKKKFKNLRTTFGRERERVEESKRSGGGGDEVFVPKWKHYKDLLFLNSGTISVV